MQVTESTKFLANEILDYLRRFPERHNQNSWVSSSSEVDKFATSQVCNSTMCVAGTAVFLTTPLNEFKKLASEWDDEFETEGARLLGLDDDEANSLFYAEDEDYALNLLAAVAEGDEKEFYSLSRGY